MTQTASSPTTLVLRHTYDAPREKVFDAWTTPEAMKAFMGPADTKCPEIAMDFRVGGRYRITMLLADGETMFVGGVYREIKRPERIACTWKWEEDDPALEQETLLTLDFIARGAQTELVLTHENFRDSAQRDRHEHGWSAIVEQLAAAVAK
ncbi:MAG: SRPBCC domain-containing protein [Candidatus Eremiobacteraeota bacterium]|nr:SRPBCC domain-containing protein [Candidatus Eremiobacteraeota bacterium]